jgi:hypothetical protein
MKFTETRQVWITSYTNPEELSPDNSRPLILSNGDMHNSGWSLVGTAEVDIELCSREDMVSHKIDALKDELQADLAAAEVRQSTLRDKISKLLAITHEVREVQ